MLRAAVASLRAGRRRVALAAVGVLLAAAMAGAAVLTGYGLHTGWDRAADQADLPDVIARFGEQDPRVVAARLRALPNVEAMALRSEIEPIHLHAAGGVSQRAAVQLVDLTARRGYVIVEGRDLSASRDGEAVLERGVARAWGVRVGDRIRVGRRLGPSTRVVGIAVGPDNVAFPLAAVPRVYVARDWIARRFGAPVGALAVSQALVWTRDPSRTDVTLREARATAFGIRDLRFVTRAGVRVLIDQAAGIVVALLVAFSLVALGAAGVMLAAQAAADVQRQLPALGVRRALGFTPGRAAVERGVAAGLVGLVAGGLGVLGGAVAVSGPSRELLFALNEQPPGSAVVPWLVLTWLAVAALVAAAAFWPAWRAARRPVVALLRGAELAGPPGRRRAGAAAPAGAAPPASSPPAAASGVLAFFRLGARLALARRGRAAAAIAVLAASGAVVLLMLGLASLVTALRDDPGSVGKRYALTARGISDRVGEVRALPGVADAAPRYVVRGADSYALGEPVKLVALPGDHTRFEDPPLADGRRLRGPGEAEIGEGLANALGVRPGGTLAVQLPRGGEVRFRVVGTVRALDDSGRVAYIRPDRLTAADPSLVPEVVVKLDPGASKTAVSRELTRLGAEPATVGGATTRSGAFLDTLAALLRAVAVLDALVCLYALAQALALTARERRPTLALLRATGAPASVIRRVLVGAAVVLTIPAVGLAWAIEHWLLAPLVGRLAAGYADLDAGATGAQVAGVASGALLVALVAALLVSRRAVAEPPVAGLREE